MSGWGRGGTVGIGAAIHAHARTERAAAEILEREHGTRHAAGERADCCPLCQPPRPTALGRHARTCRFRRAVAVAVAVACEHGFDCCPTCDPCTCGASIREEPSR